MVRCCEKATEKALETETRKDCGKMGKAALDWERWKMLS